MSVKVKKIRDKSGDDKYIEPRIMIDGSPYNRLQVYMLLDHNNKGDKRHIPDSKNNMNYGRPCIVIQEGEIGKFYGNTKLIVVPITKIKYEKNKDGTIKMENGKPIKKIKSYTMDFLQAFVVEIIADYPSECLIYNSVTRVESELKKWYNEDTKKEVFISVDTKVKILRISEEYNMESLKIETEVFGRKTVYQELQESYNEVKESNKELRDAYNSLELSYNMVKESNKELKEEVNNLEVLIRELHQKVVG